MSSMCDYFMASLIGLGCNTKRKLLSAFGSSAAIWEADDKTLKESGILNDDHISILLDSKDEHRLISEFEEMKAKGIRLVTMEDEEYPRQLLTISDPPYGIFYKGRMPSSDESMISIVGARNCSAYGQTMARELAKALSKQGYSIVSGMAKGIDGYAHDGALVAKGRTYAVLGCGVDICYPRSNKVLYDAIIENGGILSEYPPGTNPLPTFFPMRNRIISGLSRAVIVAEARERSGSLITADLALEQGRDVYAVPGRITDDMSTGCNRLIAQGAGIVYSKESLISDLSELAGLSVVNGLTFPRKEIELEKEENKVYSCFDFYAKSIDSVQSETGMDLLRLLSIIMSLCEKGLLKETFKNEYIRLA